MHQIHQTAVEGQRAHTCAELSKEFFVLPGKDLSLFPQVKGGKDVGSDGEHGADWVLGVGAAGGQGWNVWAPWELGKDPSQAWGH